MTTRRTFLGMLAGGLLAASRVAHAQPAGKVYRMGYLEAVHERAQTRE